MKYIKQYENSNGKYWLIPTDDRYKYSLIKIGCNGDDWINMDFTNFGDYIYMLNHDNIWEWDDFDSDLYKRSGYTYMGKVNIEDYEIDQIKYNL